MNKMPTLFEDLTDHSDEMETGVMVNTIIKMKEETGIGDLLRMIVE